jgi:predicted unusual protein kinase regulating ubiquinone biosynthesis (AarF/ABC1/UbiB family)
MQDRFKSIYHALAETLRLLYVLLASGMRKLFTRRSGAELLRDALQTMGPVYVKTGQVLSTRVDALPPDIVTALGDLRERVHADPPSRMRAVFDASYPQGVDRTFASIDFQPIACGCVAQVYKARLHNGDLVAVKVLRPGIDERIRANFSLIYALLRIAEISSTVRAMGVRGMVDEIRELLLSQTDMRREAENYQRFHKAYDNHPFIHIPKTYEPLSTRHVLVMEFVDAVHPYRTAGLPMTGKQLASRVDDLLDVMVFINGLCHADLHPGNFFWDRQAKIVLIDLGLVHQFSQMERCHVMTFYLSLVEGFYDFATRYFVKYFVTPRDPGSFDEAVREKVFAEAYAVIREQYVESGGKPNFSRIFQALVNIMYRYRLRLIQNYSKIFLTLVTVEGYLYSLDPEFDMIENARKSRMKQAEYTNVPVEAERLVLGDFGTYSTALFGAGDNARHAWEARDNYVLDALGLDRNGFLIDVGCGRGNLLHKARARNWRTLGITISRFEHEACKLRQLDTLWSSWEDFERDHGANFPKADAITAIEVLFHLANLHENREGLLARRLSRFFEWTNLRLHDNGRLFLQTLNVVPAFISGENHQKEYARITAELPWIGFTTVPQILECAGPFYSVIAKEDHSEDLLKTFTYMQQNIHANETRLQELVPAAMYGYMQNELSLLIELSQKGILRLHRWLLVKQAKEARAVA